MDAINVILANQNNDDQLQIMTCNLEDYV